MDSEADCGFEFRGKRYEANGAMITPHWVIGYMSSDLTKLLSWKGVELGNARVVTSWRTPSSYVSDRYYQIEVTVNGVVYTGRSAGAGMLYKGKVKRNV